MNEPTTVKRRGRPPKKSTRRVENADEPASASEPLDSRDAPSYSVQEDVLIYTTEPASRLIQATVSVHHRQAEPELSYTVAGFVDLQIEEPDSDTEAEGNRRAATPSMSHRVVSAAQAAKDTVQDTLTSAMEQAQDLPSKLPFGWPALLGLLLLTLLAGHGLSSMLRPHYKSDDVSYFSRSVDQANHRYHQLKDYVHKTERQLKDTEGRLKDALKQVNFLHTSHSDTAEHHSALQDQMHKLSTKVSQAAHVFGSKSKGWLPGGQSDDSEEEEHGSNLPSFIENPIRELIQQQLETFASDKTGIPDWALLYAGGRVVGHSKPYKAAEPPLSDWAYWGCYFWPGCHPVAPRANKALLTPKVAPGQCFPLNGDNGWVDIQLHHPIELTGFSLEHIPSSIAYNVSSAPKIVSLVGLTPPTTHLAKGGTFTPGKVHGPFKYDVNSNAVQTYSIFAEESEPVQHVRLQVHSNHGHPEFTCLYRLRVHGEPVY